MGERSDYASGTFCFADVGTTDRRRAAEFYGELFGWKAQPPMGGYTMFTLQERPVAGMFEAPEGYTPAWISYISVADADATAAAVRDGGGSVLLGPRAVSDAAEVGRTTVIEDPQGAVVALWEPGLHRGAGLVNQVATMVWNQLATPDLDGAREFYAGIFDWSYEPVDGSEPPYCEIRNREGWLNGGAMALPAEDVPPYWHVIFTVEDAQAATARVEELGGSVLEAPTPTPVGTFAVVADPAGAAFGFFEGDVDP